MPLVGPDRSVASGLSPPYFRDVRYRGVAMRLYTMRLPSSSVGLVRTARALTEANATIGRVRWLLLGPLTLGGALARRPCSGDWPRMQCSAPCVRLPAPCVT